MDTILEKTPQQLSIVEFLDNLNDEVEFLSADPFDDDYNANIWVKEKTVIRPSSDVSTLPKLIPGLYMVDFNRDFGLFCQKIKINTDELFIFSNSVTDSLFNEVNTFWSKTDLYDKHKLLHKRGILLEGFPGTGKTSIITQLSNNLIAQGGIIFKVQNFRNLDSYISFINTAFRKIQPDTPIITIIEDINQYEETYNELLDFLDGKSHINHHIVIATTNNVMELPDALLRPSRFDLRVEIKLPDIETRKEFFRFKGVEENFYLEIAERTEGCSLADLKEIYISVFLLGYSIEDSLIKVMSPRDKIDYSNRPKSIKKLGL